MPTPPPAWYDPSWGYRKSHIITGSTGAGTDYQVKITVHKYGTGGSGNSVNCEGHCLADFGDIRFTTYDGTTLLDYWMESYIEGDDPTAIFWVKISADLDSNATIYIYYGNFDASTTSSGADTFINYDEFDGVDLQADLWAVTHHDSTDTTGNYKDITVAATANQTGGGRAGCLFVEELNAFNDYSEYETGQANAHYGSLTSKVAIILDDYFGDVWSGNGGYWVSYFFVVFKYSDGSYRMVRLNDVGSNEWRWNSICLGSALTGSIDSGNTTVLAESITTWHNGDEFKSTDYDASHTVTDIYIGVGGGADNNTGYGSVSGYIDNVKIRKYVDPEPVNSIWGAEETSGPAPTSVTYDIDSIFQALEITKTTPIDTIFKKLGIIVNNISGPQSQRIINGGFELGYEGWTWTFGVITSNNPHSGYNCAQSWYNSEFGGNCLFTDQTFDTPIPIDTITLFTCWIRSTEDSNAQVSFWIDGVEYGYGLTGLTSDWQQLDLLDIMVNDLNLTGSLQKVRINNLDDTTETAVDDFSLISVGSLNIDTIFQMSEIPVGYLIDADFEPPPPIRYYLIDTQLMKYNEAITNQTDVLIAARTTKTNNTDVLFKKLDIPTTASIDIQLQSLIPPTPTPDVPETLMLVNPNGTLWCRPISWKESQECPPAIRPIPLAQSEYLDADTWVLKPRTLECKIRLSDREKDIFELIYGYASTVGANQYTDLYLIYDNSAYTWHYMVWIREKSYSFEYIYQVDRYVRWWTVSLMCDVQEFSGSSSTIVTPDFDIYPIAMSVSLADEDLEHILDFSRDDQHPPMIPNWINQLAEVDSYIWNECVLDVAYTCRMTNEEKYHLDLLLQAHQKVVYADYIHNIFSPKLNESGGAWITSISAQWDSTNWIKPWKVTVTLKANNSETESRTANVTVGNVGQSGIMYIDEFATALTLGKYVSDTEGKPTDVGVHKFYYFSPIGTIWDDWIITGDAIKMQEISVSGEHILTVFIYGDCFIGSIDICDVTFFSEFINGNGEQIINGGFETGDFTGWTTFNDPWVDGYYYAHHTGTYGCALSRNYSWVRQTFEIPIPVDNIVTFTAWMLSQWHNDPTIMVTIGYSDSTTVIHNYDGNTFGEDTWVQQDLKVLLTAGKTVLYIQFEGRNLDLGEHLFLDDVSCLIKTEHIVNGGFEDDITGWTGITTGNITTEYAYSGTHSLFTYELGSCIQTLDTPVPVSDIILFGFWYAGFGQSSGLLYCEIYYSDSSIEILSNFGYPQSWTYYDILANLAHSSGKSISAIEFSSPAPADPHWIDNVSLLTSSESILNKGVIVIDGGAEHDLPFDEDFIPSNSHTVEYIPDGEGVFILWESSSNITISDINTNPTTFTVESGTTGWIKVYFIENSLLLGSIFFDLYVTATRFVPTPTKIPEVDITRFPTIYMKTKEINVERFSSPFTDMTGVPETFTKYECEDLNDIDYSVNGNVWVAQTFTPSTTHNLKYVVLSLSAPLGSTGNVMISIKATDENGKPTGPDLATGMVKASQLDIYGVPFNIYLTPTITLNSSTQYAIVIYSDITATNAFNVAIITTNGYLGGSALRSTDGGSTWTIESSNITFQEWGYE